MGSTTLPSVTPALPYLDAPAAIRFLTEIFGLRATLVVPAHDGSILHAELQWRNGFVFVESAEAPDVPGIGMATTCLVLESGVAVDEHHERVVAAGVEIVNPLGDTPFGSHQYAACDPEGNVWVFGTYQPTVPTEAA